MSVNRKVALPALSALAAVITVAACGSSSKSSSTTTTSPAATSAPATSAGGTTGPPATGSPIKVGLLCDCSGALSSSGVDLPDVYKAWANTVNLDGGINGHPIQVILENDDSLASDAVQDTQTLVASDHVIAIVDMSNLDETWASYVEQSKVPVIGAGTSTTPMMTNPDFYPEGQTEDALFPSIIDAAKSAGATNLGLLYCAEAVQCQEGIAPLKQVGQQLGLPVTYAGEVAATAPSYAAQCIAAQQDHITALFVADIPLVIEKVATDCDQQGYHPIYVIDGESLQPSMSSTPGLKDDMVAPSPNLPFFATTPPVQAMNAALDKYYPGLREDASQWDEVESEAWPSGILLEDAAKAGGLGANGSTPTSAQLITGLQSLNGDSLGGWASPLTFPANKAHTVDCWFTTDIKNGQFGLPDGTQTTCSTS